MWLLDQKVFQNMQRAWATGVTPTAVNVERLSRVSALSGSTAVINITGVMTKSRDFIAEIFGGGNITYPEIIEALTYADDNSQVSNIQLVIDSPGGQVSGLYETVELLQLVSKPVTAVVSDTAASAAYILASQADTILAANRAARIGSFGVAASFYVLDGEVDITNTDSPNKRPDVMTDEGKAVVRAELDAIHALFAEAVAIGRETTVEQVNENYGRGATLLADEALRRGMIDGFINKEKQNGGNIGMDLQTLKAQHPAVYADAVQVGVNQERDRVTAHAIMGENSGDIKTALAAIQAGEGMTATLQATYMAASMNQRDLAARQADDGAVSKAADGAEAAKLDNGAEQVVAGIEARFGGGRG